jgi:hypothetical protein
MPRLRKEEVLKKNHFRGLALKKKLKKSTSLFLNELRDFFFSNIFNLNLYFVFRVKISYFFLTLLTFFFYMSKTPSNYGCLSRSAKLKSA